MPTKSINMHGKIYDLADKKIRTKLQAQKFAGEIREKGKVAFLNPSIKKGKQTTYFVYEAEKSVRTSNRKKSIPIETFISELSKGKDSFSKWCLEIKKSYLEAQKEVLKKEVPKKETSKKETPKKVVPKKKGNKKKSNNKKK